LFHVDDVGYFVQLSDFDLWKMQEL